MLSARSADYFFIHYNIKNEYNWFLGDVSTIQG